MALLLHELASMEQTKLSERLLADFSPRLDSALVLAIAADAAHGDGDQESAEANARVTLQALADAVDDEPYSNATILKPVLDMSDNETESATEATSIATTATDDEAVERAFQAWTIEDSRLDDDAEPKDLNATFESGWSATADLDPISFLKNLFPKRERIELQVAFSDANDDVEVGFI